MDAYVLLGTPGAGKTESFKREADMPGCAYITARDFLVFGEQPGNAGTTFFIDGLDERRAGLFDGRTPLDEIRRKLDQLGRPRFRLSCREADWFGANDRERLKAVSPDGGISVVRLDPLPKQEAGRMLEETFGISDPAAFIASAKEQGIGDLLSNPQMLGMLVEAVNQSGGQVFPRSRAETFDLACRQLLSEHSDEHRLASGKLLGVDALMDAAGRLCAIQLLTGSQGYRLPGGVKALDFPNLDQMDEGNDQAIRHAIRSKLFHTPSEGHVAPIHRQVAEFLAARYLVGLISNGLPLRRAFSLITGYDGIIVSELRGLSAWLAAHSKSGRARAEITARDPLGTLLYGDVRDWFVHDKALLLEHLGRESKKNPWSVAAIKSAARFGDISTQDMAGEIRQHLEKAARDDASQAYISNIVEMLRYGEPLPGIAEILLDIARDASRWIRIRRAAIDAFIRQRGDEGAAHSELINLLDDVYAEKVRDTDDNLLAGLLSELYPAALSAPEALKCLRVPEELGSRIEYDYFWTCLVPKKSTADQLAQLLDGLLARQEELRAWLKPGPRPLFPQRLLIALLSGFLKKSDDEVDSERLFRWLGAAPWADDCGTDINVSDEAKHLASWLRQHPELWKSLWRKGLKRCIGSTECAGSQEFHSCMATEQRRVLLNFADPRDLGFWHLEEALATKDHTAREWLMNHVVRRVRNPNSSSNERISLEAVKERLAGQPDLQEMFKEKLGRYEEGRVQHENYSTERDNERNQRQKEERQHFKPHEAALRENQAEPGLLYNLALVYLGANPRFQGEDPRSRLFELLGGDHDLMEAVLRGLRGSIDRPDIPSDDEVIRLNCESKRHVLAVPIVAGLQERARAAPEHKVPLDNSKLRLALAVHYTEPHWSIYMGGDRSAGQKSLWFPPLLKSHPHIVSEVLIKFVAAKLRGGASSIDGLYELAHSQDHKEVAQLAVLRLLDMFPARCSQAQLQDLRHLLHSAALNIGGRLAPLIERKLTNRSMNPGQRVYWLAAGLLLSPDQYAGQLDAYVAGGKRRIQNMERFFGALLEVPPGLFELLDVSGLKLLVRHVGANSDNDPAVWGSDTHEGRIATQGMHLGLLVRELINRLASDPSAAATEALRELASAARLAAWRPPLLNAAEQQERTRREGEFQHASLEQALATLRNQKPANAADLAALVTDQIVGIAGNIRNGNASGWRQYWNVDSRNRAEEPRPEDACRDALLSGLQQKLSVWDIDAQPEGRYADDKRADIRVSCNGFNVPVEIKKSCHRDVWSAIENQLIAKYARDPGADGHGIYVVFWFGNTEHCHPKPGTAGTPRSAAELEQRIRESLAEGVLRKISVCAIDVANPQT